MKKKFFKRVYGFIILLCFSQVFHYGYNAYVVDCYKHNHYNMSSGMLTVFDWTGSYVSYYNQGNLLYQQGRHQEAIVSYQKALDKNPKEGEECAICINMALAYLKIIEDIYGYEEYTDMVLGNLYLARDILMDEGCAGKDGDGHSVQAEQLKKEIELMIEEIKKRSPEEETQGDASDTSEEKSAEDAFEEKVKNNIRQKQSEANKERQTGMEFLDEFRGKVSYDPDERVW